MKTRTKYNRISSKKRSGIVLLLTLVIMVVLAILTYSITTRVAAQKHRNNYLIDYQTARYACDSAIKYSLTYLEDLNDPTLIERPNEPDFSDLFALDDEQYRELVEEYLDLDEDNLDQPSEISNRPSRRDLFSDLNDFDDIYDINGIDDSDFTDQINDNQIANQISQFKIPGPYGPPWPYVREPLEFQIGTAEVKIVIEDENAKYPIPWAILHEEEIRREALISFITFCEWMDVNSVETNELIDQLEHIATLKTFKMKFKPIKQKAKRGTPKRTGRGRRRRRSMNTSKTKTVTPASAHTADFARLFHSSLIDYDILAKSYAISEERDLSALKYIGLWGSNKVNINTAPRHVLEAAFIFGGNAVEIADEIIELRKIKPFNDIGELKEKLFKYSVSIDKSKDYITMVSDFFTIKVTVTSGNAKATAVIAVQKVGEKLERVAVIAG